MANQSRPAVGDLVYGVNVRQRIPKHWLVIGTRLRLRDPKRPEVVIEVDEDEVAVVEVREANSG